MVILTKVKRQTPSLHLSLKHNANQDKWKQPFNKDQNLIVNNMTTTKILLSLYCYKVYP